MVALARPLGPATFADLAGLPDDVRAEIIDGMIVEKASPSYEHGRTQLGAGKVLSLRFDRRPGGQGPGGWWLGTEIDVEYARSQILRHDLIGWRRDRLPAQPTGRPIRFRPDWVGEVLSPSNQKRDRVDKLQILHSAGVPHYWILDPEERILVVHRHAPDGYLVALTASSGDRVRAEPFDAVELPVDAFFGATDED